MFPFIVANFLYASIGKLELLVQFLENWKSEEIWLGKCGVGYLRIVANVSASW